MTLRSETFSVPVPGGTLRVRRAQTDGFPTLLVHGGPGGTDYLYKFFAKHLADLDHQAASYIQRGSPGSDSDGPFTIERFADDLDAVRAALGWERFALVGHSWGGLLSTIYAARHPERIARLVLICPIGPRAGWWSGFEGTMESRMIEEHLTRYRELGEQVEAATDPEEEARLAVQRLNIAVKYYYGEKFRPKAPDLAHMEWRVRKAIVAQYDDLYADPSWERGLARLAAPCSVIFADEDPVPRSVADVYGELLPHPEIREIKNAGHFPWMEDPEQFFEVFNELMQMAY